MYTVFILTYVSNEKFLFSTGRRKMGIFKRSDRSSIEESIRELFPDICDFEISCISKSTDVCDAYFDIVDIEIYDSFFLFKSDFLLTKTTVMQEIRGMSLYDIIRKYYDESAEIPEFVPKKEKCKSSVVNNFAPQMRKELLADKVDVLTLENVNGKCSIM